MPKEKVIIWVKGIDDLIQGEGQVGGLTVQMMFWSLAFRDSDFQVFTFTNKKKREFKGLSFLRFPENKLFNILFEFFYSFFYIIKIRPDIILFRGASRSLFLLSYLSSLFKVNLIFMGASDVNFIVGEELISGKNYNKKLYRIGLKKTKNIIVQNKNQADNLFKYYGKKALCISNIWGAKPSLTKENDLIIWVGNFRKLKRPEWFIRLSSKYPKHNFVMAGAPNIKEFYDDCRMKSKQITNLEFLGPIPFSESEKLFDKAKLLICTSEFEGFPNTFLQAWSRNIPIISTVDPNELFNKKQLGIYINNENELSKAFDSILNDNALYENIQNNISHYFEESHDLARGLEKMLFYIK